MQNVYVFGASDDIICVDTDDGFIEHFDAFCGGVVIRLKKGEDILDILATFTWDGKWVFSPLPSHDNPNWAVTSTNGGRKLGSMPWEKEGTSYSDFSPVARAAEHTQVLTIKVPKGIKATLHSGMAHRSQSTELTNA